MFPLDFACTDEWALTPLPVDRLLPWKCKVIGLKRFDGRRNLCRVGISDKSELQEIGSFAFRGCRVADIFLPSYLRISICSCQGVLLGVNSVKTASNGRFIVCDECVFSKTKAKLFHCSSSKEIFHVPDSVKRIDVGCFSSSNVKTVVFGERSKIFELTGAFLHSAVENVVFNRVPSNLVVEEGIIAVRESLNCTFVLKLTQDSELFVSHVFSKIQKYCVHCPESAQTIIFDERCDHVKIHMPQNTTGLLPSSKTQICKPQPAKHGPLFVQDTTKRQTSHD